MKVRKTAYNVDYFHLLTFKDYYREVISPYFNHPNLQYGIDAENTVNESIRLIYKNESFTFQFRKDGATFIYEGDVADLKKSNPVLTIYFDILDKIRKIPGFTVIKRHKLTLTCVEVLEEGKVDELLLKNEYTFNPFGKLKDFGTILEWEEKTKKCRMEFGSFSESDIKKYDISPFKTKHNKELPGSKGLMCQFTINDELNSVSHSQLKSLIQESESFISKIKV
jgi:hypothetical protein